jgi:O-antigen biosynthesis protein
MRLSLFTPTHNPKYLLDTYKSLQLQSVQDWEWIVLPNNRCADIPEPIRLDSRVRVVPGGNDTNIGALKRKACDACSGNAFIEMDHDDLLTPGDALSRIREQFQAGAGFVYSDVAVFRFKPKENTYSEFAFSSHHGWKTYDIHVYGRKLKASCTFEVSPRSLCEIYYAPDHVRCWSRKAYYEAGGHNPDLSVCDDHELMIKTYLSGAKFSHTGGCHYLYRMFDSNTVIARNREIQDTTRKLKEAYLKLLIASWLKRHGLAKLDLTTLRKQGWKADQSLVQGFGTDCYGHIVADMELQKLSGLQVREFMNEAYKALVPGGYLTLIVPDFQSRMSYADVEWQTQFSDASMYPYTQKEGATVNGNIRCRFQQIACNVVYPTDWHRRNDFKLLRFDLAALKGQHFPGLQLI